mgnify:CR=1 FL=1
MENVAVKERTPLITKFVAVEHNVPSNPPPLSTIVRRWRVIQLMLTAVLYLMFAMFASNVGVGSVAAIAASVSVIAGVAFTLMIFNAQKNK